MAGDAAAAGAAAVSVVAAGAGLVDLAAAAGLVVAVAAQIGNETIGIGGKQVATGWADWTKFTEV